MANGTTVSITDFSPGLMTNPDARALAAGGAQVCRNGNTDRGDLRVREGRVAAVGCPAHTTVGARALQEFYVAGHSPTFRLVGVIGSRLYWSVTRDTADERANGTEYAQGKMLRAETNPTPAGASAHIYEVTTAGVTGVSPPTYPTTAGETVQDGTAVLTCRDTEMFDEIDASVTVHASNPARMAQYGDKLYIVDGENEVRELDADGRIIALEEFPSPSIPPALDTVTVDLPVDPCDQTTCKGGDGQWLRFGGSVSSPPPINKNQWYPIAHPTEPNASEATGIFARAVTANAYPGKTASMSLFIRKGTSPGATMDCGDVWVCRKHENPPNPDMPPYWDLQEATVIMFSVRTTTGAATTFPSAMELLLGEEDDRTTWQSIAVTEDEDGTLLAAMTNDTWYNFVVDITGLTAAQRDAVRYIGFRFTGLQLSHNEVANAAIIHFSPITANLSSASFISDTYEFTYTLYSSETEEESGEYIDPGDLAHPYPSLSINTIIPQAITATCTRDIGHLATTAYLYARGGTSKVWRRVGEAAYSGDDSEARTVEIEWTGEYSDTALLSEYVGKPPVGVTMLCSWHNRMVYVGQLPMGKWKAATEYDAGEIIKPATRNGYEYACVTGGTSGVTEPGWATMPGETTTDNTITWRCQEVGARDVLYFSNFGDPAHVPIAPTALQQVPATYGGWADLERWGHDVTGLAPYGSALVAFKRQGIWVCQGDPGDVSFRIDELDRREGCMSQESITQAEGKLIWQARDKILALAGMDIVDISLPIAPTVQGYTAAQQGTAFAVYDPRARRYLLVYPSGSYGASPNSEALVLQLKNGSWTQYTAQPGGCGLYTQHAEAPGVYLADLYGTGGRGKVFLVSPAAVTDAASQGDAAAIDWQWVSGEIVPVAGRYTQVQAVRGNVLAADTGSACTLACALWLNNSDDRTVSRNLTVTRKTTLGSAAQASGMVDWTLAPHGECESFALKLGRYDSDLVGVRAVSLAFIVRQPLRGRTVARG